MTAAALIDIARREIGTVERPANSNRQKYGAAYGMDGVAWCNQFTWWCFREAGLSALTPKSAYTPATYDWYRRKGLTGTAPRPGALVFFDFPNDGVNRISHIGIVEAVNRDGSITTIEGNTSSGSAGSQRDGGGVYRRVRKVGIVGYAYPAYPSALPAPASATPGRPPASTASNAARPTIRRGSTGAAVQLIQRFLGVVGAGGPGYGTFGPATEAAVIRYQKMRGLAADGVVGPATWRATGL